MDGCEWVVEAYGCDPSALADTAALTLLFARMTEELQLHPLAAPTWYRFPVTGGVTGFVPLAESHLACHTFPEYRSICLNLFCCRQRPDWSFAEKLRDAIGAQEVRVRRIERPYRAYEPESSQLSQLRSAG